MSKLLLANLFRLQKLRTYARNTDGVAALEFALIAPVMLAFYFGLAEVTMAISRDRQVSHTAAVVGDLTTRLATVDRNSMADVMTAALAVLEIRDEDINRLSLEIISYEMSEDSSGATQVTEIGKANFGTAPTVNTTSLSPQDLETKNLISDNSGAVVTRINYRYKPVNFWFMNNVTLNESIVQKPRGDATSIAFTGSGGTYTCSANTDLIVTCS